MRLSSLYSVTSVSFFFVCFLLAGCSNHQIVSVPSISLTITSPIDGWQFYENSQVMFSCNLKSPPVVWTSSLDGPLGSGHSVSATLSPGQHIIIAEGAGQKASVAVRVASQKQDRNQLWLQLINRNHQELTVTAGKYLPVVCSRRSQVSNASISVMPDSSGITSRLTALQAAGGKNAATDRTNSISVGDLCLRPQVSDFIPIRNPVGNRGVVDTLPSQRSFFVMNTQNQLVDPHIVSAHLYRAGNRYTLWIPDNAMIDKVAVDSLLSNFESLILPRVTSIFGKWADVDGDGRIAILLCPTINTEGVAVGYFNPADLFVRDTDSGQSPGNPHSNELDIVYLAMPSSSDTGSYSVSSVCATLAHELTHSVTYNQKTFSHILQGNKEREREVLIVDEGLSHLSESLCGFGVSGGNTAFVSVYLQDTACYSLSGPNALGQEDSAGARGGMLLFLSWLYRKSRDGNLFIKNILNSNIFGWEVIGEAMGTTTDQLFVQFAQDISLAYRDGTLFSSGLDSVTEEPVYVFCNMGDFHFGGKTHEIGFPNVYRSIPVLPSHSLAFLEEMTLPPGGCFVADSRLKDEVFFVGLLQLD